MFGITFPLHQEGGADHLEHHKLLDSFVPPVGIVRSFTHDLADCTLVIRSYLTPGPEGTGTWGCQCHEMRNGHPMQLSIRRI